MSMRELHDVVLPHIDAVTNVRVYAAGDVPNLPETPYAVVHFQRRGMGAGVDRNRLSDDLASYGWRLDILHVGGSSKEAEWIQDKITSALEGHRFTLNGQLTTPMHYETGTPIAAEAGVEETFTGTAQWTCVANALAAA